MEKNVLIGYLLDFYGELLTKRQRECLELHYNDDYSLNEIAEDLGISRQGVHDAIKRGETALLDFENRLKLFERFDLMNKELCSIKTELQEGAFDRIKLENALLRLDSIIKN